jgi:hypothetical protein
MGRTILFWWACIREAAHGTIERANAWFWLVGIPIVAIAGRYWEIGQLTIPDTAPEFIVFMAVTVAVSWVVFFAIRLVGAPARLYARLADEKCEIEARVRVLEQQRATLTLNGPLLHNDPRFKNKKHWRMKVHNAGPATARDVKIRLKGGAPEPKDSNWTGDYPYAVYPIGTIKNYPGHINAIGRQINANDDERYEITCGWKSESGQFFTDVNTKGGGHNNIQINSDERWRLSYEVTAENTSPIRFTLEIFVEDDEVKVAMVT